MESLSNHKRLRTESNEEKMIPEQFGIVKVLLKQLTDNLYSIQSFKNIPKAKISSLKGFKVSIKKMKPFEEYLTKKELLETEEDQLHLHHEFGTLFSEDDLFAFLSISIIKLINNITGYKALPDNLSKLLKDLKKKKLPSTL